MSENAEFRAWMVQRAGERLKERALAVPGYLGELAQVYRRTEELRQEKARALQPSTRVLQ